MLVTPLNATWMKMEKKPTKNPRTLHTLALCCRCACSRVESTCRWTCLAWLRFVSGCCSAIVSSCMSQQPVTSGMISSHAPEWSGRHKGIKVFWWEVRGNSLKDVHRIGIVITGFSRPIRDTLTNLINPCQRGCGLWLKKVDLSWKLSRWPTVLTFTFKVPLLNILGYLNGPQNIADISGYIRKLPPTIHT